MFAAWFHLLAALLLTACWGMALWRGIAIPLNTMASSYSSLPMLTSRHSRWGTACLILAIPVLASGLTLSGTSAGAAKMVHVVSAVFFISTTVFVFLYGRSTSTASSLPLAHACAAMLSTASLVCLIASGLWMVLLR